MWDYIKYTIVPFMKKHYITITVIIIMFVIWTSFITEKIGSIKDSYEAKMSQKSDIEALEAVAKNAKVMQKDSLKKIKDAKKIIEENTTTYEMSTLVLRCILEQISRKINWEEYSVEYCKNNDNLNKFRMY